MDILSRPVLAADYRIWYGKDASQFGDLWLPDGLPDGPSDGAVRFPLVVFFHGGWWKSEYDLGYAGHMCAALKATGIATWSVEYRRVGHTGGGWPATFLDAAAGFDCIATLCRSYPLDLSRVTAMGHSAGGHLAFWVAGRKNIRAGSELVQPMQDIQLRAVIGLAGAVDLRLTIELAGDSIFEHDRDEVYRLMGASPDELPERYAAGNPGELLPLQAPQILLQGIEDDQIPPELPGRWVALSRQAGSQADMIILSGAGHFDVVDPTTEAWMTVLCAIKASFGNESDGESERIE